jgi:membrane-associated phospholipid phosphatase
MIRLPAILRTPRRPTTWLLYIFVFAPYILVYQLVNRFPIFQPEELPFSTIDQLIPFMPVLLPLYVLYLPFFWWTGVRSEDDSTLNRFFYATHLQLILCATIWLLYPVRMPRELFYMAESYGWADTFWRWFDDPNNCFPSLHAANGLLFIHFNWRRPLRWFHTAVGVGIILSTVFVKQHYVIDVAAGGIVYLIALGFLSKLQVYERRPVSDATTSPRGYLGTLQSRAGRGSALPATLDGLKSD